MQTDDEVVSDDNSDDKRVVAEKVAEEKHILTNVPAGKGVLLTASHERQIVDGPFDGDKLCNLLKCSFFQMIPAMGGALRGKALLLMDEEGKTNWPQVNELATREVGGQVIGGKLHGNVLVCHPNDLE